jgi:small subunit ribosomal protein S21
MIIIDVTKEKNIESALRIYKSKVQKSKQMHNLKERKEYIKPSIKKRKESLNAIYVEKLKNGLK